jgi:hypothetical protein
VDLEKQLVEQTTLIVHLRENLEKKSKEIIRLESKIDDLHYEIDCLQLENEKLKIPSEASSLKPVQKDEQDQVYEDLIKSLSLASKNFDFIEYKRKNPPSKKEIRHLRVQAVGLALWMLSRNKIGIEDICRHEAMIKLNPYYFQAGLEKKLNIPKKLLRQIAPEGITIKGRKRHGYYTLTEVADWGEYKNRRFCRDTYDYYKKNKPLPEVFQILDKNLHIDIVRVKVVLDVWWEMVSYKYIHDSLYHNELCLGYFGECKYLLGRIFPDSMFGEWYAKMVDEYMYEMYESSK